MGGANKVLISGLWKLVSENDGFTQRAANGTFFQRRAHWPSLQIPAPPRISGRRWTVPVRAAVSHVMGDVSGRSPTHHPTPGNNRKRFAGRNESDGNPAVIWKVTKFSFWISGCGEFRGICIGKVDWKRNPLDRTAAAGPKWLSEPAIFLWGREIIETKGIMDVSLV